MTMSCKQKLNDYVNQIIAAHSMRISCLSTWVPLHAVLVNLSLNVQEWWKRMVLRGYEIAKISPIQKAGGSKGDKGNILLFLMLASIVTLSNRALYFCSFQWTNYGRSRLLLACRSVHVWTLTAPLSYCNTATWKYLFKHFYSTGHRGSLCTCVRPLL